MAFVCETCDFETNLKSNYERHLTTKKHLKLCGQCEKPADNITLEKHQYELRIKELETSLKYEQEKNELLLSLLNKRFEPIPEPVPEPIPEVIPEPIPEVIPEVITDPIPEPISEVITDLIPKPIPEVIPEVITDPIPEPVKKPRHKIVLLSQEPIQEPTLELTQEPKKEVKPKSQRKTRTLKEFLDHKCSIENNTYDDFLDKINERISKLDINMLCGKRINKMEYVFNLINDVYQSYDKYNKPFYCDDRYHKNCYMVENSEWIKNSICGLKDHDVLSGGIIGQMLSDINGLLLNKAEEMGKIIRVTDEMFDQWFEDNKDTDEQPPSIGSLCDTSELKNIKILDYDDYNVYINENTELFMDIIFIKKEEYIE